MRHVRILATIGLVAAAAGALTAIAVADLGPDWYPIVLALTSYHAVWISGVLHGARHPVGAEARSAQAAAAGRARLCYESLRDRRRRYPATIPASPNPVRISVAGSGTGAGSSTRIHCSGLLLPASHSPGPR